MTRLPITLLAVALVVPGIQAADLELGTELTAAEFADLTDALADAVAFPNAGPAEPVGVVGLEIVGMGGGPSVDSDSSWWRHSIQGGTTADVMQSKRLLARKGLPRGFDLGVQGGEVAGERFYGGELRVALLKGGTITPALGVRVSYSRFQGAPVDLEVGEAQLAISKGFLMVTPYAAAGYRLARSSATIESPTPVRLEADRDGATAAVGVRITPFPFLHVLAEARKAANVSYFVALGVGF